MATKTIEGKAKTRNGIFRVVVCGILIVAQIIFVILAATKLRSLQSWFSIIFAIISVILALGIYSQYKTSSLKLPWIILILLAPVTGIIAYAAIGLNGSTKKMRNRYKDVDSRLLPQLPSNNEIMEDLKSRYPTAYSTSMYIKNNASFPVYRNTNLKYFSDTKEALESQLKDMAQAQKFIFMEYHAIEDSTVWSKIKDVLVDRVKSGVKVRVFYDDLGSIGFINLDFPKKLEALGIECRVFNPCGPILNIFLNNRDHRKITVIDGKVGYTGGYNIANEYFNLTHPYGRWKDSGIRLEGEAVNSLTVTFLEMWNASKNGNSVDDDLKYVREIPASCITNNGFIQPYADSPLDHEQVGEEVYISIINSATKYIYITTPYLILTDEMTHALCLASKRGVDVRIVTPGIPDKKLIYDVTRSFYSALARNGVKIYEWTPGFCHAKMCISDDILGTCGTINFDYRSFYHHFENGCYIVDEAIIREMRKDFEKSFIESVNVTEYYNSGRGQILRFSQLVLRLVAGLL